MMAKNIFKQIIVVIVILCIGCTERFTIETRDFESILVVESTITDELKYQEIKLSRSFPLEENYEQIIENNAAVYVIDNTQNTYNFVQNTEGVYISETQFKADENISYTLKIITNNGDEYTSTPQVLPPVSQIDNLYPQRIINSDGEESVQILVDSNNETTNAKYFRYEYTETYKIIAPHHSDFNITMENYVGGTVSQDGSVPEESYDIIITPREQEEEICYATRNSIDLLQYNISITNQNSITGFPVKSLKTTASELITRYTIQVRQYSQSIDNYTFYKVLNELGNLESILSQSQPGFLYGNITNVNDNGDKIIGLFDVSAVDTKRIYFNYTDLNLATPPYFYYCDLNTLSYADVDPVEVDGTPVERHLLYLLVYYGDYKHVSGYAGSYNYTIVNSECGDCTTLGTNIQPDFWED